MTFFVWLQVYFPHINMSTFSSGTSESYCFRSLVLDHDVPNVGTSRSKLLVLDHDVPCAFRSWCSFCWGLKPLAQCTKQWATVPIVFLGWVLDFRWTKNTYLSNADEQDEDRRGAAVVVSQEIITIAQWYDVQNGCPDHWLECCPLSSRQISCHLEWESTAY